MPTQTLIGQKIHKAFRMKGIRQFLWFIGQMVMGIVVISLSAFGVAYFLLCGFSLASLALMIGGVALAFWLTSLAFKKPILAIFFSSVLYCSAVGIALIFFVLSYPILINLLFTHILFGTLAFAGCVPIVYYVVQNNLSKRLKNKENMQNKQPISEVKDKRTQDLILDEKEDALEKFLSKKSTGNREADLLIEAVKNLILDIIASKKEENKLERERDNFVFHQQENMKFN